MLGKLVYVLTIAIQIGTPLLLGFWLVRRAVNAGVFTRKAAWGVFGVGVLTFIGSQVVHIPLLQGLTALFKIPGMWQPAEAFAPWFNAIILGLMAGLCEEPARWIGFKLMKTKAQPRQSALLAGAGHGGIESIFIGLLVLVNFVTMLVVQAAIDNGTSLPAWMELLKAQAGLFWSTPWHHVLAGGVERLVAIILHLSLSVLVWRGVTALRGGGWWLAGAILVHGVVDMLAVASSTIWAWQVWPIEVLVAALALGSAGLALWAWKTRPQA
ncbi:MAG TPA: YhfC family glutamic-type intramembrane protease [Anaerolineaceae bacterium]|nr:YhfC family glutamic-type intramembrane protease [Anaerolineaceae bacterium]